MIYIFRKDEISNLTVNESSISVLVVPWDTKGLIPMDGVTSNKRN